MQVFKEIMVTDLENVATDKLIDGWTDGWVYEWVFFIYYIDPLRHMYNSELVM